MIQENKRQEIQSWGEMCYPSSQLPCAFTVTAEKKAGTPNRHCFQIYLLKREHHKDLSSYLWEKRLNTDSSDCLKNILNIQEIFTNSFFTEILWFIYALIYEQFAFGKVSLLFANFTEGDQNNCGCLPLVSINAVILARITQQIKYMIQGTTILAIYKSAVLFRGRFSGKHFSGSIILVFDV